MLGAVEQETLNTSRGEGCLHLAFLWSPPPNLLRAVGQGFPTGLATENSEGYSVPPKNRAPTHPGPGTLPGGAEEFTAAGTEAVEGGGAATAGALVSGGNIRSCFLTFNFLR